VGVIVPRSKAGTAKGDKRKRSMQEAASGDPLFEQMLELDRLEELLEELSELGITSVEDLEARIRELEAAIDDAPAADGS
jgi:hypothetical protein